MSNRLAEWLSFILGVSIDFDMSYKSYLHNILHHYGTDQDRANIIYSFWRSDDLHNALSLW